MDVTKINWKQKLTSRKMWMSVAAFVSAVLVCVGMNDNDIAQITSIIMAGATMIAYILGEGLVDAERLRNSNNNMDVKEQKL